MTNDVEALEPGSGCYAALLDHKGKMRADMRVLRGADLIWLDSEPVGRPALARNDRACTASAATCRATTSPTSARSCR